MIKNKNDQNALLMVLLAALFGGGIPVFAKIGLKEIPPFIFTFLRFFIASLFLLPLFLRTKPVINKGISKIILISFLGTINVTLFALGIRLTTATVGQVLYAAVPLLAVLFSKILLKEKITLKKLLGIGLGFLGVSFIIFLPIVNQASSLKTDFLGNLLIFAAVISFSLYSVLSKKIQLQYSPIYLTTIFSVTTVMVLFILSIPELKSSPDFFRSLSLGAIVSVLYVSLFGSVIYYLLYQYAIKHGTPVIASLTMFLQPTATFAWAFILLGEHLTPGIIMGTTLAFIGILITTRKD